jgi:hypothetical protein
MAEALLGCGARLRAGERRHDPDRREPADRADLAELGIDWSRPAQGRGGCSTDPDVVTVCDEAQETCPHIPGDHEHALAPTTRNAAAGTDEARMAVFRRVRDEIAMRIDAFLAERSGRARERRRGAVPAAPRPRRRPPARRVGRRAAVPKKGRAQPIGWRPTCAASIPPDALISSPKLRATQTAEPIAEALRVAGAQGRAAGRFLDLAALEEVPPTGDPARRWSPRPRFQRAGGRPVRHGRAPMRRAPRLIDAARPSSARRRHPCAGSSRLTS